MQATGAPAELRGPAGFGRNNGEPLGGIRAADRNQKAKTVRLDRIILVGAGGVGGFIAKHLGLLIGVEQICIIDGDTFETKNRDRQMFSFGKEGWGKAQIVAKAVSDNTTARVTAIEEFITEESFEKTVKEFKPTLIISAVDNDEARKAIFAHNESIPILWGANELWTPQAGISLPWKPWSPMEAFKPAEAGEGCNAQTVHANSCAAGMAMMLLSMYSSGHEDTEKLPIFLSKSSNRPIYQMLQDEI